MKQQEPDDNDAEKEKNNVRCTFTKFSPIWQDTVLWTEVPAEDLTMTWELRQLGLLKNPKGS